VVSVKDRNGTAVSEPVTFKVIPPGLFLKIEGGHARYIGQDVAFILEPADHG